MRDMKPKIFSFRHNQQKAYEDFKSLYWDFWFHDLFKSLTVNLYLTQNPSVYFSPDKNEKGEEYYNELVKDKKEFTLGNWVVHDWRREAYHLIDCEELLKLRTARNRDLITWNEQKILYSKNISLAGLSVGSNVLMALVRMGVGSYFKISDFDTVDAHNLNRANYFLRDVGVKKSNIMCDHVYGVDPYLKINVWDNGINHKNVLSFIRGADVIVDTFDHMPTKILLRRAAKKMKKPVVSGFDVSRGVLLIVERYDKEKDLDVEYYLNGVSEKEMLKPIKSGQDIIKRMMKVIGVEHHDERILKTVLNIGNKYTGVPQIIIATYEAAALFTMVIIDLLLDKSSHSIRKYVDLNKLIYKSKEIPTVAT